MTVWYAGRNVPIDPEDDLVLPDPRDLEVHLLVLCGMSVRQFLFLARPTNPRPSAVSISTKFGVRQGSAPHTLWRYERRTMFDHSQGGGADRLT